MRIPLATAVLTFVIGSASAEHMIALVQPKTTSLMLTKIERKNDLFAEYKGQVQITGTLVAEWVGGKDNLNYQEPDYSLVPDLASARRLPHFSGYAVQFIELRNGLAGLELAAGKRKADQLMKRQITLVKVTGSFVVQEYVVGVECDAAWAKASLVSAHVPERESAAAVQPIERC